MVTATAVIQRAKDLRRFLILPLILGFHGFSYSDPERENIIRRAM